MPSATHRSPLVTVSGKAGTGKTLLALAAALEQRTRYRQIMLARPIVPLSNKDIGYLPGDIQSKISPYMQPLYDNSGSDPQPVFRAERDGADARPACSTTRSWSSSRWPTFAAAAW